MSRLLAEAVSIGCARTKAREALSDIAHRLIERKFGVGQKALLERWRLTITGIGAQMHYRCD
jgi:hypothetical protein